MVIIHMKSTIDRDEFIASAPGSMSVDELTQQLANTTNLRIRLQAQLSACYNLATESPHMDHRTPAEKQRLLDLHQEARALLSVDRIAKREACTEAEVSALCAKMEEAARELFPERCVDPLGASIPEDEELDKLCYDRLLELAEPLHKAGVEGVSTGVDDVASARETLRRLRQPSCLATLWKLRDDPDIGEDERLRSWYWLELMDPDFKARDYLDPAKAQLWTCGKPVERQKILKDYAPNEKTKLTCKFTQTKDKGCPGREARMSFQDQRECRRQMVEKREIYKTLEQSELAQHPNVRPQNGPIAFRAPGSSGEQCFRTGREGDGLIRLNTDARRIHNSSKVETLVTPP
eukprot:TRINITY_DN9158_c0_g1_i1.p1 TRINITY_DN9158_c0_g1~~TRINITY_DN9158_c0_g1_i1.p1  ORF type:complete len:377 (+),score=147.66 TRINITY_DN9158_c0_g1_i1:87-1133(+)